MLEVLQNDISPLELLQSPVSSKLKIRSGRQRGGPRVPWFHQRNPNETFWDPRCTVEKRMCLQPATCSSSRCCHESNFLVSSIVYFIIFYPSIPRVRHASQKAILWSHHCSLSLYALHALHASSWGFQGSNNGSKRRRPTGWAATRRCGLPSRSSTPTASPMNFWGSNATI